MAGTLLLIAGMTLLALLTSTLVGVLFIAWNVLVRGGSAWGTLARRFPGTTPPGIAEADWVAQTVAVDGVRYRRCVAVAASARGLRLSLMMKPPLLIPWSAIRAMRPAKLDYRPATELMIGSDAGSVSITIPAEIGKRCQSRLPAAAVESELTRS